MAIILVAAILVVPISLQSPPHRYPLYYLVDSAWAGYVDPASRGTVSVVSATWIQPADAGFCGAGTNTDAYLWTGMDGWEGASIEQIGTEVDCENGTPVNVAWYEYWFTPVIVIPSITVQPGDTISASVSFSSGSFTLWIEDVTQHTIFQNVSSHPGADRDSADWIVESPYGGTRNLTDFGQFKFLDCSAKIGGQWGLPDESPSVTQVNMTNSNGTTLRATPSLLNEATGGFAVDWNSGPP